MEVSDYLIFQFIIFVFLAFDYMYTVSYKTKFGDNSVKF